MEIQNIAVNISSNFKGKRPNDSTYRVIKHPETASDNFERAFVDDFLRRNPDWEKDEALVHRLKQDTVAARALGKIHSQWHEFDIPPALSVIFNILLTAGTLLFLQKNKFSKLNKFEKVLFTGISIISPIATIGHLKYIFTGRNLFEKKNTGN